MANIDRNFNFLFFFMDSYDLQLGAMSPHNLRSWYWYKISKSDTEKVIVFLFFFNFTSEHDHSNWQILKDLFKCFTGTRFLNIVVVNIFQKWLILMNKSFLCFHELLWPWPWNKSTLTDNLQKVLIKSHAGTMWTVFVLRFSRYYWCTFLTTRLHSQTDRELYSTDSFCGQIHEPKSIPIQLEEKTWHTEKNNNCITLVTFV